MAPAPPADTRSEEGNVVPEYFGDEIDGSTFEQILEMDDEEDDREFSRSIVFDFFQQADATFKDMDEKLKDKDLPALSALGHFLKGSSATLGLTKVKDSCEKIQHLGQRKDETGTTDEEDDEKTLKKISTIIEQAKKEFKVAARLLKRFFGESEDS